MGIRFRCCVGIRYQDDALLVTVAIHLHDMKVLATRNMECSTMEHELHIEYRPIDSVRPNVRNARTHSMEQTLQIARSIELFGFINPILVDGNGTLVAGHGR